MYFCSAVRVCERVSAPLYRGACVRVYVGIVCLGTITTVTSCTDNPGTREGDYACRRPRIFRKGNIFSA